MPVPSTHMTCHSGTSRPQIVGMASGVGPVILPGEVRGMRFRMPDTTTPATVNAAIDYLDDYSGQVLGSVGTEIVVA